MKKISLIGCGRWGTFLGWYAGNYCGFDQVDMYDIPTSPNFIELRDTRKNPYLSLSDNMILHDKIEDVLKNDIIIVSIVCQHFLPLAAVRQRSGRLRPLRLRQHLCVIHGGRQQQGLL